MSGPFDRVWTQQPQVAVPAANGQIPRPAHLWALNVAGARQLKDSAGAGDGVFGSGTGGTTGDSWNVGPDGYYIVKDDSGTGSANSGNLAVGNSTGSGGPTGNVISFAGRIRIASGTVAQTIYCGGAASVQFVVTSANKLQLVKTATAVIGTSNTALTNGVDYDVGFSYDGSTVTFYLNGVADGSTTSAQTFTHSSQYYLFYNPATAGEWLTNGSRFYRAAVWNSALPAAAFRSLVGNGFWKLFGKRSNPIFVGLQAASTVVTTTGDSSVTLPFTGTSVAVAPIVGTSTGTLSLTPVSAAVVKVFGAGASQTIALTGTSVATDPVAGASSGTVSLTGTSAGTLAVAGASAVTISVSPASSGGVAVDGDAVGTISLAATSAATVSISGASASQSVLVTGTSAAAARVAGASSQSVSVSGTSAGAVAISGASANQTITLTGTATASTSGAGYSAAEIGLTGTATAITSIVGASTATFDVSEAAVGSVAVDGDAVGTIVLAADSTATVGVSGASVGASFEVTGVSTGLSAIAGSSAQQIDLSGSGYATFLQRVTSTASFDILAVSAGIIEQPSGGGGVVDPAAVWNYSLSNGKTAGDTLVEMHAMLRDLYRIHGLEITMPLSVTPTERTAGPIVQAVTEAVGAVTVARQ